MSGLITALENLDRELIKTIDVSISPVLMLEDIESGSLRTWLREVINVADDQVLKEGDWKKILGTYLVKAKYIVVKFLDGKPKISSRKEIEMLQAELVKAAEETQIKRIPMYSPIPTRALLGSIQEVNAALGQLGTEDKAEFISAEGEANFNLTLEFSLQAIEELLTKEVITSETEMILKVKKPDYLGESMWEFRFAGHPIDAKILDLDWLEKFQSRAIDVRPGDALRAMVKTDVCYGYDGEVVATKYMISKVKEVVAHNPPNQIELI